MPDFNGNAGGCQQARTDESPAVETVFAANNLITMQQACAWQPPPERLPCGFSSSPTQCRKHEDDDKKD
jgi:hypothetical protein